MCKRGGTRQHFIEPIEPRILLAVFAQDYSFQPAEPPSLPAGAHSIPISKGRFIVTTYKGGGDDDRQATYTRVFADGSPDKSFGQHGSLVFDVEVFAVTFTGSRFIAVNNLDATASIYTINGKPDESVSGGTGNAALPYKSLGSGWSVNDASLEYAYSNGSMLFDVESLSNDASKSHCQLLKVQPDLTLDPSFGANGIVTLPTGKMGTLRDSTVGSDAIYLHVVNIDANTVFHEKLLRLTPGGKVDTTFGTSGQIDLDSEFEQFGEAPNGRVMVLDNNIGGGAALHRFNHDGTPDKSFGKSGSIILNVRADLEPFEDAVDQSAYYVDAQNRILVATGGTIFRLDSTGKLDSYPFNGSAPFDGLTLTEDSQGRILTSTGLGVSERFALLPATQLDASGVAHVTGTIEKDSMTITRISDDRYQFVVNGVTTDLSAPKVKEIDVNFFNGGSTIDIDASVDAPSNIQSGRGDDSITTGNDDDTIVSGGGSDTVDCGDGNDSVTVGAQAPSQADAANEHRLTGGTGNKTIDVLDGSTDLNLSAGDDNITIEAQPGNGTTCKIALAGGSSTLDINDNHVNVTIAGRGNNSITLNNVITGSIVAGDGNDTISVLEGEVSVLGGGGNDLISSFTPSNNDYFSGGGGNDTISAGTEDGDTPVVGNGDDTILGGSGDDSLDGGPGDDYLSGNDGRDTIHGEDGNDSIYGGAGSDRLYSEKGNDLIQGQGGDDRIFADYPHGTDGLFGGPGNDRFVTADKQLDSINGGSGNDTANADQSDVLTSVEN